MARSSNQKLKLLYLLKILHEKTDESHPMTTKDLIRELSRYQITAERKSIYDDIGCLTDFGFDIVSSRARTGGGYYLASREFELPELKLLVDAVQASRFITEKKSGELIAKLERLAGPYEARKLQRQVLVAGRIKADNESIYYNVDRIHNAIQEDRPITFTYLEWTVKKVLKPRRDGQRYRVSPLALAWREENYYLIARDEGEDRIKHYRVDKMSRIEAVEGEKRTGTEGFGVRETAEYVNKTFGMFGGEAQAVTLLLPSAMIGVMLDRFGREIDIRDRGEGLVSVRIKVAVSGQFYGWLCGLGGQVKILAPAKVRQDFQQYLQKILEDC